MTISIDKNPRLRGRARRCLAYLAPAAITAGGTALVVTADSSADRLNYVNILVWPTVLLYSAWWLRDVVRNRISHLEQVNALGVEAKFGQYTAAGNPHIRPEPEPTITDEIEEAVNAAVDAIAFRRSTAERLLDQPPSEDDVAGDRGSSEPAAVRVITLVGQAVDPPVAIVAHIRDCGCRTGPS